MKGKRTIKTIAIAISAVVLLAVATTGTVVYLKDNSDAEAKTANERNIVETLPVTDDNEEAQEIETTPEDQQEDETAVDPNVTENTDTAQQNATQENENAENQTTTQENRGSDNQTTTQENRSSNNQATPSTGDSGTDETTTTEASNTPSQEYVQTVTETRTEITEEPWETKSVGWFPKTLELDVNDIDINKPKFETKKTATVNSDDKVTTVFRGDIITYKIYVKNTTAVKFESITVSDTIPEGTIYVEDSIDNNGNISQDGELTWKVDLNAGEEKVVSYKVKVILESDSQEEIMQIDNTAKVNEEDTNTTHNPTITYDKQVKVIAVNGEELDNQIVAPGTRLRYYINLTNASEYDAITRVTDVIPEGTSLIAGTISNGGAIEKVNQIIWEEVSIPAGETVNVSFDVTVNNNRKETVSNVAKIGAEKIDNQDETSGEQYTNTVKTPVFKASKQSSFDYDSQKKTPKLHETNEVTYVITVTNSASTDDPDTSSLTGTAKLEDKFWKDDLNKMTYKSGTLVIKDNTGTEVFSNENISESFLSNIEITLAPGQTATLTYVYSINEMKNPTIEEIDLTSKIAWDEISNNLYWAEPTEDDPSRPQNSNDTTNCNNTENPNDPTKPTADPKEPEKPGLIDTVIIHVEEESINIEAIKEWIDFENKYLKRPDFVSFTLYRNEVSTGVTLRVSEQTNWKGEFNNLRKTDINGNPYVYTIMEDGVNYYKTPAIGMLGADNKITITNYLDQLFITEKKSSKEGLTVKEKEDIDYTITVYNVGNEDGTTSIRDVYRSGDEEKFEFKSGTVEYYNSFTAETPTTVENITSQDYLKNKITLNIKGNGKAVIKYICTANVIDENKAPDSDGVIRESIVNDLYWAKTNDTDPDDPRYPTDEVIDTVTVNLEKEYTEILATKIWEDETDTSKRPETIKFTLQKWNSTTSQYEDVTTTISGEVKNVEKTLSAANAVSGNTNKWQVKFDKLIKYDEAGNENVYAIREETVEHYIAKYSEDKKTVTNIVGENIQAQVITSNANIPTVPMDVVFVLDVSSSMLKDPGNKNLTNGNNNKISTAKAITMVDAVNTAIDKVLESNPENRVAVQLYNSRIESSDYEYYLIELDKYNRNSDGKYITYSWSTTGKRYNDLYRYDGVLTTNLTKASTGEAVSRVGKVLVAKSYSEENIIGTYTQAGIQRGEQILTGATNKTVENQEFTRIPVLILVTDGDPTHYNPTSVGTSNIISSTDSGRTTYPTSGDRIPREKHSSAEYYYYTIKQLEASKDTISTSYSNGSSLARTCRVYTIGIGLKGSMAEALLNPSSDFIENNLEDANNINPNIDNGDGNSSGYNNSRKRGAAFYTQQQTRLKDMLLGHITGIAELSGNYTDRSFNIQSTQSSTLSTELEGAFYEALQDSLESIENRTIGEDRRIDLTDIAVNRRFEITITGNDYNDNPISVNKSFETFNAALGDSTVNKYIKGTTGNYYIDLSELKSGSVTVTYVRNNSV